ncbi:hypothetical protein A9D46_15030 [Photobacterium damselae subsp. damselae]|uniref:hypothetical protein n=1 Tax=Photobacterium damselae TaxID=38293 RepID=UPI00083B5A1E|nr:hypothetical protein [Photobacterium damselae]KAB1522222.1 hypothetical protein FD717_000750 [Photobacterium damselae subsp. damselae]ODA23601.1 hypothetical protein A0J46_16690 [Photobacterium damselae subsp. damselae]OEC82375.1 hypothetical protein A9D46_15030 [Photobacterium damselae subsp. damselae]
MELTDSIQIHYDGKGENITAHLMPSSLVSSSVKAFDTIYKEAFKEANKIYGSNLETDTYVQGGFEKGSLKWLQKLVSVQNEEQIQIDCVDSQSRVTAAVSKVVSILTRLDHDMPEIVIQETSDGYAVNVKDGTEPADELVCAILTNGKIRKAIGELTKPLTMKGIDSLTINSCSNGFESIEVGQESANILSYQKSHVSLVEEGNFVGYYQAEDLSYNPKKAWKFNSIEKASDSFSGIITDENFWSDVAASKEKFAYDDIMKVEVSWKKVRKSLTSRSTITYVVTKIERYDKDKGARCKIL